MLAKLIIRFTVFCCAASLALGAEPTRFSVQMHSLTGDLERHKKSVDLIRAAGIRQGRDECFWHLVEKEKGVYRIPENILKNLDYSLSQGLETLIILDYANMLYDGGMAPTSPEGVRAFGQYCFTMARELKGRVKYFEVWNEPNVDGFWKPKADPTAYAILLKEGYRRIKEGNPEAVVCGVSLAGIDDVSFIEKIMEAGGYGSMDILSLHPYCTPRTPEEAQIFERMGAIRDRLGKFGAKKDIWVTEVGWPTNLSGGVTEYEQAVRVSRAYLNTFIYPFVKAVFIYWFGPDGPDAEWAEDRFGMIHQDWSPKPAFHATKTLTGALEKAETMSVIGGNNFRLLHLKDGQHGKMIYALWAIKGYADFEGKCAAPSEALGMDGSKHALTPWDGGIRIRAGEMPVLIASTESIDWNTTPTQPIQIEFEGGTNFIPRGQGRPFKLLIPDALQKSSLKILSENDGLFIEENRLKASLNAKAGVEHFTILATPAGDAKPYALIMGEAIISEPLSVEIKPLPPTKVARIFQITLQNLSLEGLSGTLTLTPPDGVSLGKNVFEIKPLSPNAKFEESVEITSDNPSDMIYEIKGEARLTDGAEVQFKQTISFYECIRTERPLMMDGNLSDWNKDTEPIRLGSKEQYVAGYVPWGGEKDLSARVYTCWDENWFYIGLEFQDDMLSSPCAGFSVYNNDGIEIYFDIEHDEDRHEAHYSADDHQYGFYLEQGNPVVYSWSQLKGYSKDSRIAFNPLPQPQQTISGKTFKGMILEGCIPMKELNLKPHEGLMIGFNVSATDDDDPRTVHPFFQESQFSWTRRKNSWQNPQTFADLHFTDSAKIPRP